MITATQFPLDPRGACRTTVTRVQHLLVAVLAGVALSACGSDSEPTTPQNSPPLVQLLQPTAGATFNRGAAVGFAASATDAEDGNLSGASIVWTSDRDGSLGTGNSFSRSDLSVGTHTITVTAADSQGATTQQGVTITIVDPNTAPQATIVSPANGTTVNQGSPVTFQGSGSDAQDGNLTGSSLAWASDRDGAIGTGTSVTTSALSVGTHVVTLTVTDSGGLTDSETITLVVVGPDIVVSASLVDFAAAAGGGDPPAQQLQVTNGGGGSLTGLAATTSYATGQPTGWLTASLSSTNAPATLTLSAATGALGQGTYNATVTVSSTAPGTDPVSVAVRFVVGSAEIAEVAVTSPIGNVTAPGFTVQLQGTATDAGGATIPGVNFAWTSSNTAVASFTLDSSLRVHAVGTTTLTASAGGHSGTLFLRVVPADLPGIDATLADAYLAQLTQSLSATSAGTVMPALTQCSSARSVGDITTLHGCFDTLLGVPGTNSNDTPRLGVLSVFWIYAQSILHFDG